MLKKAVTNHRKATDTMSLLEEYYERYEKPPEDKAKKILFAVVDDLLGRKGFDNEWDGCDTEIREEILQTNLEKIQKQLS